MRVRFVQDFQGVLTDEQFFTAGQEADFPEEQAAQLIQDGRAEAVPDDTATGGEPPAERKRKR